MNAWYVFWQISVAASLLLFFGVAFLVITRGWRDAMSLYRHLYSRDQDAGSPSTPRKE